MVNIYVGFCAVFATQPDIPMRLPIHVFFFFFLSFFLLHWRHSKFICCLSKIRPFLTEKAAVLIYKSNLPYIDYGDTVKYF